MILYPEDIINYTIGNNKAITLNINVLLQI